MAGLGFRFGGYRAQFRTRLILSFFIVVSLTAAIMGFSYYRIMREELKTSTVQGFERLIGQSADALSLQLETIRNIGLSYFTDVSLQKYLDNPVSFEDKQYYRNKLEVQRMQIPTLSNLTIVTLDQDQISSMYYYNQKLRSLMNDELMRVARLAAERDGAPLWTSSVATGRNSLTPTPTISFVQQLKRVTSNEQHPVGYLKIDLDPAVIRHAFQGLRGEAANAYYIVDDAGTVVFAEDETEIGRSLAGDPLFVGYRQAVASPAQAASFAVADDRASYIGLYRQLNLSGWVVLGKAPLNRVYEKVNRFRNTMLAIGLAAILAAMLLSSLISAGVTRPLKMLNKKMKQVEMGDFDAFIEVKGRNEFSTIQHSFNKMTAEIRHLITKVYETELLKKEAEIKALQSQINPHFLYNTLGTIDSLSAINGEMRIVHICQALGGMLRYNLNGGSFATIREELNHLDQYLSIYVIRFAGDFRYEIEAEPGTETRTVPKFLLQPLVENAVIHGLEPKIGTKEVKIRIRFDGGELAFTIEDNGVGMASETLLRLQDRLCSPGGFVSERVSPTRAEIGLANVCSRIQTTYGRDPRMVIRSLPQTGTRIDFSIPQTGLEGTR
ncbi:cache domain-containing sensor histidine kinase [Cohnella nanjingensis]|uniref:Sensor histidine kinase n=1 Tax=Cohnella nanjingensis TaxID=1387779 RepID=A0A7X0RPP0_9BACL|nr:sensor histidine kinase [Cohnella nanjingensis]MBB6671373.1 sensor histidine kinase [Cohnella nanjingensis]